MFLMTNIDRLTSASNLKKNFGASQDKVESYLLYRLRKLDLVDSDDCGVALRAIIEKEGVVPCSEGEPFLRLET